MSTPSQTQLAKLDKQKSVVGVSHFVFRSLILSSVIALSIAACSLHQNGAADQKVAPTLGVSDAEASRGPASVASTPYYANPDEKGAGQTGAPGAGFDTKSAKVRDSADPTAGIKSQQK